MRHERTAYSNRIQLKNNRISFLLSAIFSRIRFEIGFYVVQLFSVVSRKANAFWTTTKIPIIIFTCFRLVTVAPSFSWRYLCAYVFQLNRHSNLPKCVFIILGFNFISIICCIKRGRYSLFTTTEIFGISSETWMPRIIIQSFIFIFRHVFK